MAKQSLVGYRRTSSDMDLSSTDEDDEKNEPALPTQSNGSAKTNDKGDECSVIKDETSSIKEDRLRDDRREREPDRKDSRSREYDKGRRDKRKEYSDTKSSESDRRKRKSPDRSRGRHRSRSPGRRKHSPDRRRRSHSPEHRPRKSRRSSRSPESFRSKRLERKVARIDKLGLEVFNDIKSGFYNPGGNPTSRITEQIQKRRLLWGAKKETPPVGEADAPGSSKAWEAATFKGDNDGKMTEKFKRLMGIKGDAPPTATSSTAGSSLIQKQEEMFSKMEAEYQVARMATHTHRGIGLGFGTFQVPPR